MRVELWKILGRLFRLDDGARDTTEATSQVGSCFSIWTSVNTPSHISNPKVASTEDSWSVAIFRSGSLRPNDRNPMSGFDKQSSDDPSSSLETSRCRCVV